MLERLLQATAITIALGFMAGSEPPLGSQFEVQVSHMVGQKQCTEISEIALSLLRR